MPHNEHRTTSDSSTRDRSASQKRRKGTVAVVGLGYVGLPLALLVEQRGHAVIGIDIDRSRIRALQRRSASYLNPEEEMALRRSRMRFTNNPALISEAEVIVICVPTPVHEDHSPDLGPLRSAAQSVGKYMVRGSLVIVESTVNPGVCEEEVIPILEHMSHLRAESDFYFAHCPERINPGDSEYSVANIPRVIGAASGESAARAAAFYQRVLEGSVLTGLSIKEAESVKMVENAFRDINIAFVNELAMSFDRLGIDLTRVISAAATKPFGFMAHYPGCGVGGHCIPVDPYYLIDYAQKNGFSHTFIKTARKINSNMPLYTVNKFEAALASRGVSIAGTRVALLGLAYKRDISDTRESPSFAIADELARRGAIPIPYDPYVLRQSLYSSLEETLEQADAAIIATDHTMFRELTPEKLIQNGITVILDGRNCLPKEDFTARGMTYYGIGR